MSALAKIPAKYQELLIASRARRLDADTFMVPSENGAGVYKVTVGRFQSCTCASFSRGHRICKHIRAVNLAIRLALQWGFHK